MVLLYHLFAYTMSRHVWTGAASAVFWVTNPMWRGVDLFFVLSGFLITGILLDTSTDAHYFRNFYARRALRILPLYYLVLPVIFFAYPNSGRYSLLVLLFLCNMAPIFHAPMLNGALWSLSVEEHFYMVWPLVARRMRPRHVATAAGAVCVLEPLLRGLLFGRYVGANLYVYSWFRLDGLASGALIACLFRSPVFRARDADRLAKTLIVAGLVFLVGGAPLGILNHTSRFGAAFQFVPANLIFSAFVLYAAAHSGGASLGALRGAALRKCADLSYCMYIVHCMLMNGYDALLTKFGWPAATSSFPSVFVRAAVILAACFVVASLTRKFIELPALRLKRFFRSASDPAARAASVAA